MKLLSTQQLRALTWAVGEAETWRGSLIGNPDPVPLQQFDATITKAKEALKVIRAKRVIPEKKLT